MIGDIVGSRFEYRNYTLKDFELLADDCYITDDSIMTVATMQALLRGGTADDFIAAYQSFGRSNLFTFDIAGRSHGAGYGSKFFRWLMAKDPQPYGSFGNGAPMRVSPVAWFYDTLDDVERMAEVSASVTHNHPEGIKGAKSVAAAIYLARTGKDKSFIRQYIERNYGYDLTFTLDEIRGSYEHSEACQDTVPQAIVAFLEGEDFEDVIRNAVSIGGDSDTIAAMAGAIAEAFYEVADDVLERVLLYIPANLNEIVVKFHETIQGKLR